MTYKDIIAIISIVAVVIVLIQCFRNGFDTGTSFKNLIFPDNADFVNPKI